MTQRVAILGATGSIGQQALDVIDRYPQSFEVFGLASGRRSPGRPARFLIQNGEADYESHVEEMVTHQDCDIVLVAIPGSGVLAPTLAALRAGKKVALATKEVLVMAGDLVMAAAQTLDAIRPVDSEHSAIWQCLWGESPAAVARLLITATGGPFWHHAERDLAEVTIDDALQHPRWSMGPKITVDSATMMNKGLEVIEAHHLFRLPLERIDVIVHPQAVIHSMVEFVDGSTKAQLGNPDMRLPIALALSYPDRLPGAVPPTRFAEVGSLELHALDHARFRSVTVAREAAARGGCCPAVLNAANEVAVANFLRGRLRFVDIVAAVEAALDGFAASDLGAHGSEPTLEQILAADAWARAHVAGRLRKVEA